MATESAPPELSVEGALPPGKPSKKKLIIIIVAAILVIGGVVGGLFASGMFSKKPAHAEEGAEKADGEKGGEEAAGEGEADKEGGEHGGGEKKEGGKESASSGNFYEMPNMIVNLTGDNGKQRFLKISITLELNKKSDSKVIEAVLPRVTDHFQTYLRELRLDDLRGSAGLYRLRQELLDRVHSAAGVDVKDVLFEEILVQ